MVKHFVPEGVMPALVTPFTKDGDLLEEGFKQIIDYVIEKGATGIVPSGTTGEFVYMRTEERKRLLRLAVEFADGRVPVVAGTGQTSTGATVELTRYAADIGCDAALVISPFYLRPADKGYYEHYATVARKTDMPIIVYNIPQCTLGPLHANILEDLAEIDNIVAVKDSSGNIPATVELIQKLKGKLPVLIGHDECFLSAVAAGAKAAILASGNIIPHIWLEIMKMVREGNMERAMELQHSVQTLARLITRNGGAPPVKAALRMMGIKAGRSRLPLNSGGTLTPELKDEIRMELEKLGLIESLSHPPIDRELNMRALFEEFGVNPQSLSDARIATGGNDAVSAAVAVGRKDSPLGAAFVQLLTRAKIGHEALSVILEPNLLVKPPSIMVPVRTIKSLRQASLFYGPVQSGAARAVARLLGEGKIPAEDVSHSLMVMTLDVDLNMRDRRAVTAATEDAVRNALAQIWR
ncbi:MAG: 4-hydroxy-tetrahydrodipicolinate synthase [Candidatus Thorarchaeota archaeon]|nr:MAG: 4-hydroxy-tetrahydrodipicolinate synthase [Candidatus Thorarchaeota archaeon]